MAWLPRGIWRYAVLITLLLILAAAASMTTIRSIENFVLARSSALSGEALRDALRLVTWPILALTMGFLFLAGALGIWVIRTTVQIEGRRRVGRFVDAMDYLSDGLAALDRSGRITGSNPAARRLAGAPLPPRAGLRDLLPVLSPEQVHRLAAEREPQEVECISRTAEGIRALRLRSQPAEDINLVLISDISGQKSEEARRIQAARLQLIGRMARGIAHDFNNILCAISGHAALIERAALTADQGASQKAIVRESQRGAALAAQVLALSRAGDRGAPCEKLTEGLTRAADLLRVGLTRPWKITLDLQGPFGPTSLSDQQVEQVVLNLGLLLADQSPAPGCLHIRAHAPRPGDGPEERMAHCAALVWILLGNEGEPVDTQAGITQPPPPETGVVESVVRSMLDEVGGHLDRLQRAAGSGYRLCFPLPPGAGAKTPGIEQLPADVREAVGSWRLLLACENTPERRAWEHGFRGLGMRVQGAADVVETLQQVEADPSLTVLVVRESLLGAEAAPLLRAIRKLRPAIGLVLLGEEGMALSPDLKAEGVMETWPAAETLLQAMVRSVRRVEPVRLG